MTTATRRSTSEDRIWHRRPSCANAVLAAFAVVPIVLAFVATLWAAPALPSIGGPLGLIVYFAGVIAVGAASALLTSRAVSRGLRLASLLNMSLVFPDRAPSRIRLAVQMGTVRRLRRALANGESPVTDDRQAAAEHLVTLVAELGRHEPLPTAHSEAVRVYADLIGLQLGLPLVERQFLSWAAILHDIGKLAVPADILSQVDAPSEVEWAILQQHPVTGAKLVEPLADWLGEWRFAAGDHHERWDGSGYPEGLAGNEISLAGRIVAVADAYDAMTSYRGYRSAKDVTAAREELTRCAGTQFDPIVVHAMLAAAPSTALPAASVDSRLGTVVSRILTAPTMGTLMATSVAIAVTTGAILTVLGAGP